MTTAGRVDILSLSAMPLSPAAMYKSSVSTKLSL
jgi:hypothetical protein